MRHPPPCHSGGGPAALCRQTGGQNDQQASSGQGIAPGQSAAGKAAPQLQRNRTRGLPWRSQEHCAPLAGERAGACQHWPPDPVRRGHDSRIPGQAQCQPQAPLPARHDLLRQPMPPALGMVEFVAGKTATGNLTALCGACGTMMHRCARLAAIGTIMPNLDVQIREAPPRL